MTGPAVASASFGGRLTTGPAADPSRLPGVSVGHASVADTGVTVVACPEGAVAAVDVRGGGPGTRETDLLEPHNTVREAHAIVLSGGSAFGLAAADGVMRGLAERGHGFGVTEEFPDVRVPIVPAAVIFDLLLGERDVPDADMGRAALADALDGSDAGSNSGSDSGPDSGSGCVGAGTGAMAGAIKGGVGRAAVTLADGSTVAAIVVANPMGAVAGPDGRLWADPDRGAIPESALAAIGERFVGLTKVPVPKDAAGDGGDGDVGKLNTTIGCIVTDAALTQDQAKRLAMAGHDGLARAIRPAHLPMDGDTLFCLATGTFRAAGALEGEKDPAGPSASDSVDPAALALLSAAAADAVEHAIVDAVTAAESRAGVPSFTDLAQPGRAG
ncbi:peptidase S58 family protein [Corynebacterium xerosis]|uniref:Peptidase S58 family protein n=1 Tax=Corynebacterium xerosis TaxID=1725 RepID=A0A6B8U081_9CORY|nr:P1 family peptidase [Corynebacterium xerosis]QGS34985.1 peptidase S58 family protein [Corynebacterium xerosis]